MIATLIILLIIGIVILRKYINSYNNFGNTLDRHCALYLLCGGNKKLFNTLANYLFPGKTQYRIETKQECQIQLNPMLIIYFIFSGIWCSDFKNKELIIPYTRNVIERQISNKREIKNNIVIHIRLGDIPFNRAKHYNLYSINAYIKAIDIIRKKSEIDIIEIIYANNHKVSNKEKEICEYIVSLIKTKLESYSGIICNIIGNGDMNTDIHSMYTAKCLIAFIGSFSYYIGISSTNFFISPYKSLRHNMIKINIDKEKIEHKNVKDYYDKDEVKRLLLA
jgi:hypothetical protein